MILRLLLLSAALLPLKNVTGQQYQTNHYIVENQLVSFFDSLLNVYEFNSGSIAFETGAVFDERSGFIEDVFYRYCTTHNISVRTDSAKTIFHIEQFSVEINYKEDGLGLFLSQQLFTRNVALSMRGWLKTELVRPFDLSKLHVDQIDEKIKNQSSQSAYFFLRGKVTEASGWSKYYEPAIVLISVATAIYLLFTLRS